MPTTTKTSRKSSQRPPKRERSAAYVAHLEAASRLTRERTKSGQSITIPEVEQYGQRQRRNKALKSFRVFCETYGQEEFDKPWAEFHLQAMERIESAVRDQHWYAFAFPRGGGKTTLSEWAIVYAILSGRREYCLFIAASQVLAERQLQSIKTTLATNGLLEADFPHACYPIVALENETKRCKGQRNIADGINTRIEWGPNRVVMPQINHKDAISSGFVIEAYGLETAKRGIKFKRTDQTTIRPSFVVCDDPQTRESAKSPTQTQTRLENLKGDIAYLAGPGQPISIVVPCTVIYKDDLADKILDREKSPEWHGHKTKMVESFPKNQELWDNYADMLRASLREDGDGQAATDFYVSNRAAMDEGSLVSWEHRHLPKEVSAIQHAMNLRIRDLPAFYAECQNQPIEEHEDELGMRTIASIMTHTTNYARRAIPESVTVLTAFTDIQLNHMPWMLVGWTPDFTGFVIDYGEYPDQQRPYYARADVRKKLSMLHPGDESAMMAGAFEALEKVLFVPRHTEDGREIQISLWCIDYGWEQRLKATQAWVAQSSNRARIALTHGYGAKAKQMPFSANPKLIQQKTGPAWYWKNGKAPGAKVQFDANYWKTRLHQQLALPKLARSSIQLFKVRDPYEHQMLAEHLHAERPVKVTANGRTVWEWDDMTKKDNDLLDCLVGNMVAASISGIVRENERAPQVQKKTLAQLYGRR